MRQVIFFVLLSGTLVRGEPTGKTCLGTNNRLSSSGDGAYALQWFTKLYKDCTKIEGNLEISNLKLDKLDLSFLNTIEEVTGYVLFFETNLATLPLTNLKIIRGQSLLELNGKNYSLAILYNQNLANLGLISLREISRGNVYFSSVDNLGYGSTVLWRDLFSNESSTVVATAKLKSKGKCHKSCPKVNGTRYCWGPGEHHCQKLTKVSCHTECKGRCFGTNWNQCCSHSCAGGCTGRSDRNCFRCRAFSDGGACVDFCPPPVIYDSASFAWIANPLFKYPYGSECVTKCPDFMHIDRGACVRYCPEGTSDVNGMCKPCVGRCPKGCPGTGIDSGFLSRENIESFRGCNVIQGNLLIVQGSFMKLTKLNPLTYNDLSLFENVTLIEGTLRIEGSSSVLRNLSFLRNLRTIMGNTPSRRLSGLIIYKTSLEHLGLDSLRSVRNGNVTIVDNEELCYVEKFDWTGILKDRTNVAVRGNKDSLKCDH